MMGCRIHKVGHYNSMVPGIVSMALASNHHFPRHSHDQFGIGVMTFGAHRSWSGMGDVRAEAGDVIMVNPGEIHDGAPLDGAVRGWRMIYIGPTLFTREVSEEFEGRLELVRPVARDPLLAALFDKLFACLALPQPDCLSKEESLLLTLLHLLRRHNVSQPSSAGPCVSVAKAIRYLEAAPASKVSLAELAALSGISRFQLLRAFAHELGITPYAYLVQRRVLLAQRLLADGHTPAETAVMAGFSDQSHLTRAFVRQLGVTPGRYRTSWA
jgi:AraC-like DNA-binding protein